MSGAALLALIVVGFGMVVAVSRRRWDAARRARGHQRALETMGRLAAQQSQTNGDVTTSDGRGAQAHVRVVAGEPAEPTQTPRLRSRSHRWPAAYERVRPEREEPAHEEVPTGSELPAVTIIGASPANPQVAPPNEDTPQPVIDGHLLQGPPPADPVDAPPDFTPEQEVEPTIATPVAARPTLYFDDAVGAAPRRPLTPREAGRRSGRRGPVSLRRSRRSRRPLRLSQGRHVSGRRAATAAGAVLILAAAIALGIGLPRGHHTRPPVSSPPTTAVHHSEATTVPTTVAPPAGPVLVTSTSGYSEYRTAGPATIVLAGTGRCWIEIRQSSPNGQVLYEGILLAGETRTLAGSVWLRLGNPTEVRLTVNGQAIAPPSLVPGEPYNLQFE